MKRITTTKKINETITNNLLQIEKAEIYYKTSGKTESIDADIIHENLSFLFESGCFADVLGWHYERNYKTGSYEIETGRMNPGTEIIISVYLAVCESESVEDVEKALEVTEEE